MHAHSVERWGHRHAFLGHHHARNERKIWLVILLCGAMMAAEIGGGLLFGSMVLIADGLHMATHVGALVISAVAYSYARIHVHDERFAFGTGKLGDLAAFASAIVLAMIALLIGWESIQRLLVPVPIAFASAIPIAVVGLAVNLGSAWLLRDEHPHDHDPAAAEHGHAHPAGGPPHGHDLNLRAAYIHVLADAGVSVLAVLGLFAARALEWPWIDPLLAIVGALVIANWSVGLIGSAASVLLDMRPGEALAHAVRERLERGDDRITDLHLWRVGPGHVAAAITLVTDAPQAPAGYKQRLADLGELSHVTIEILRCPGGH
jgi:cation diffusion facilitator family transporter